MDYNTCVVDEILKNCFVLLVHWTMFFMIYNFLEFFNHVIMCKLDQSNHAFYLWTKMNQMIQISSEWKMLLIIIENIRKQQKIPENSCLKMMIIIVSRSLCEKLLHKILMFNRLLHFSCKMLVILVGLYLQYSEKEFSRLGFRKLFLPENSRKPPSPGIWHGFLCLLTMCHRIIAVICACNSFISLHLLLVLRTQ